MADRTFTNRWVETVAPGPVRIEYPDRLLPGLYFVVQPSGAKAWAVRYRIAGRSRKFTIGGYPFLTLAAAHQLGREALIKAKQGQDPAEAHKAARRQARATAANTLQAVAEEYLTREAKTRQLRTLDQRRATLERLVYAELGDRPIGEIKRSEIVRLLDRVEDERGARMAEEVLKVVRRIMTWHAGRDDDFRSPIIRGMGRISTKERARSRILDDGELRAVWTASETIGGPFGALIRFILLTATRRNEAADMRRSELDGSDWTIPAARYKTKHPHLIPLSAAAQAIIAQLPVIDDSDFVFTAFGRQPITYSSRLKHKLDRLSGVRGWVLHDLRRTARSLMSRAGVPADHAERALGHVLPGIRGTYDRHSFHAEKARAFEALAGQVERIHNPTENVVPLRGAAS
jgi:integrase